MPSLRLRSFSLQALLLFTAVVAPLLASCGGGSSSPAVPAGPSFVQYALSDNMNPTGPITVGSDGALWLIAALAHDGTQGSLWRVTTTGAATARPASCPSGPKSSGASSAENGSLSIPKRR